MIKISLSLGDKVVEQIEELANEKSLTKAEVVRRAIGVYHLIHEEESNGSSIRIVRSDGTILEMLKEKS